MNYTMRADQYYSKWCGIGLDQVHDHEVRLVKNELRAEQLIGYERPISLYIMVFDKKIIISYSEKCQEQAIRCKDFFVSRNLCGRLDMDMNQLHHELNQLCHHSFVHDMKYVMEQPQVNSTSLTPQTPLLQVKCLTSQDADSFLAFFQTMYPDCESYDWVEEYFLGMISGNTCFGIFDQSTLVSCTDLPDMPYQDGKVQDIGINTLPAYRAHGYATILCNTLCTALIKLDQCPIWSASYDNIGSRHVAIKTGFREYAEVFY